MLPILKQTTRIGCSNSRDFLFLNRVLYSTLHCSYAILKIVYRSCPFFFMFVISSVVSYYMFCIQFCKRLDSNRGTLEVISTAQQSFATKVSIVVILSISTDCCSTGLTTTICVSIFFKNGPSPASFFLYFRLFNTQLTVNKCSI